MNEYIFQGEINFNQFEGRNENIHLNNQLSSNEYFYTNAKFLRIKFIIPIIILSILEFIFIFLAAHDFYAKDEGDKFSIDLISAFVLPITFFISLIIILTTIFCLEYPILKIVIYVLLFIVKGFGIIYLLEYLHEEHFNGRIISDILIGILFISLCVCSFTYQIKLIILKK